MTATTKDNDRKLLRHGVMFKFKDPVTAGQVTHVEQAFVALLDQIDAIARTR